MACGQRDPVLGPPVMEVLAQVWKNGCYYAEIEELGHFIQEWGDRVAKLAIEIFERQGRVRGVRKVGSRQAVL
jgi:haloalkane dehalogenase